MRPLTGHIMNDLVGEGALLGLYELAERSAIQPSTMTIAMIMKIFYEILYNIKTLRNCPSTNRFMFYFPLSF